MLICHNIIPPYNYDKAMVCHTLYDYALTNMTLYLQECYKKLYCNGMKGKVQSAFKGFQFSHEKYWIVDGTTVHLSTGIYIYCV